MEVSIGRLRLNITVSHAPVRPKGWEELVTVGMDDLELARLNQANTREPDSATWVGVRLLYSTPRRP